MFDADTLVIYVCSQCSQCSQYPALHDFPTINLPLFSSFFFWHLLCIALSLHDSTARQRRCRWFAVNVPTTTASKLFSTRQSGIKLVRFCANQHQDGRGCTSHAHINTFVCASPPYTKHTSTTDHHHRRHHHTTYTLWHNPACRLSCCSLCALWLWRILVLTTHSQNNAYKQEEWIHEEKKNWKTRTHTIHIRINGSIL